MTPDEYGYNGHENRATWLANVWLSNEQGAYLSALDEARNSDSPRDVGLALVTMLEAWCAVDFNCRTDFTEELDDGTERSILSDIDIEELGQHFITEVQEIDSYNT